MNGARAGKGKESSVRLQDRGKLRLLSLSLSPPSLNNADLQACLKPIGLSLSLFPCAPLRQLSHSANALSRAAPSPEEWTKIDFKLGGNWKRLFESGAIYTYTYTRPVNPANVIWNAAVLLFAGVAIVRRGV